MARNSRVCRYTSLLLGTTAIVCAGTAQAQMSGGEGDQGTTELIFPGQFQKQVVEGSEIHGRIGFYDLRRWHALNQPYPGQPDTGDDFNTENTNFGAQIGITTGRIYGFSAGAEFVYEGGLYGNNDDGTRLNCNRACGTVANITQGDLQYNAYGFRLRGGRQLLNTPLAGTDQFSFLPRSSNGVSAVWRPLQTMNRMAYDTGSAQTNDNEGPVINETRVADTQNYETDQYLSFDPGASTMDKPEWQIFGAKIGRFEGRGNANGFVKNNRYFTDVAGFWTVGTTFRNVTEEGQFVGPYYHYRFQQTESADYGEIGYMAPTLGSGSDSWAPCARAQVMAAYDADENRIPQGINNQIYGLKLGVSSSTLGFSISGNFSPEHDGSFNDGQMLHPYTDLSGVLYTDTMNNGIQEIGPGWAAGARFDFTPTDNLAMYARYVQYEAKQGHYHDFYFNGGANNVITGKNFVGAEVDDQNSQAIGIGFTYYLGGVWKHSPGSRSGTTSALRSLMARRTSTTTAFVSTTASNSGCAPLKARPSPGVAGPCIEGGEPEEAAIAKS